MKGFVKMPISDYDKMIKEMDFYRRQNLKIIEENDCLTEKVAELKGNVVKLAKSHKNLLEFIEENGLEYKEEEK